MNWGTIASQGLQWGNQTFGTNLPSGPTEIEGEIQDPIQEEPGVYGIFSRNQNYGETIKNLLPFLLIGGAVILAVRS